MESHSCIALAGNLYLSATVRCPDDTLVGSIPDNVKTLDPCLLCEEQNFDVRQRDDDVIHEEDDEFGTHKFTCTTLLEEMRNPDKLFSSKACEFLRGECVTCGSGSRSYQDFFTGYML